VEALKVGSKKRTKKKKKTKQGDLYTKKKKVRLEKIM